MTDFDRRVMDYTWADASKLTCEVDIHGDIEVDKGDFLFLDRVNGLRLRGVSTADWYGYPFSKISGSTLTLESNQALAQANFLGVAAWHKESGNTSRIAVYVEGLFRFPLKSSRKLKMGYYVTP